MNKSHLPRRASILLVIFCVISISLSAQNYLDFDGAEDHVELPSGIVSAATDFTFEANVYWDGGGNWQRIFDFGNNTAVNMFITPRSLDNFLRFAITNTGSGGEERINGSPLQPNAWHHIALVLDQVSPGEVDGYLYVDGILNAQNLNMTLDPSILGITTANYIGKSQYADPEFNGKIEEVRIWSTARSQSEIIQFMNSTLLGTEPSLIAYYDFQQGACGLANTSETILFDRTFNGLDGVLNNFSLEGCGSNWTCDACGALSCSGTPTLYQQDFGDSGYHVSNTNSTFSADDFIVQDQVQINEIAVRFAIVGSTGFILNPIINEVAVSIYDDNNGVPGNQIFNQIFDDAFAIEGFEDLTYYQLVNSPVLSPGQTYWFSVSGTSQQGFVFIHAIPNSFGNMFHWFDPGFQQCAMPNQWVPYNTCFVAPVTPDLEVVMQFCPVVAPVPTLGQWGVIILLLGLLIFAYSAVKMSNYYMVR